jgi:hypothetical protein
LARPAMSAFTIAKLESMLEQQRSKKKDLLRERTKLAAQLEKLDRQIAGLDGGAGGGGGTSGNSGGGGAGSRPRNEKSLVATLEEVLTGNPKGLSVGDIVEAVQNAGYKSSSPNFRGIINQTLIKEKKKFAAVERGVYAMKK